ncbi:MAG: hypothetical protein IOD12_03930 [Silvanigrellales bacterium]|nr:hypothetical protein [Silvanigrellales bacterium]
MPLFSKKSALASALFIATALLFPSSNAHADFGDVEVDGEVDGTPSSCNISALATCCDWGGGVPCLKQSGCTEENFVDIGRTAEQCTLSDAPTPTPGVIPKGSKIFKSKSTGYFPDSSPLQGGYVDRRSKPLQTLQQYLRGKGSYVSVAMDNENGIPYGTKLRILELERKYGRVIEFRVVDTGGAFYGKGMSRIDICTESENHAYDPAVNKTLTLVFPSL